MATLTIALFLGRERAQKEEDRLEFFVCHLTDVLPWHVQVIELMAARRHAGAQSIYKHFLRPTLQLAAGSQVQCRWKLWGSKGNWATGKSRTMTTGTTDGEILTILGRRAYFRGNRPRGGVINDLSRKCHYIHKYHSHAK